MKSSGKLLDVAYESRKVVNSLMVRGGAVQITYLEDFMQEMMQYVNKFTTSFVATAQKLAEDGAKQIDKFQKSFVIDLELDAPVLIMPQSLVTPAAAVINLGKVVLKSGVQELTSGKLN